MPRNQYKAPNCQEWGLLRSCTIMRRVAVLLWVSGFCVLIRVSTAWIRGDVGISKSFQFLCRQMLKIQPLKYSYY